MDTRFSPNSPFGRSMFWLCLLAYGLHVVEEYDLGSAGARPARDLGRLQHH